MTSRNIADLHPLLAFAFGRALAEWTITRPNAPVPFLTCTFRDKAEQTALYNQPTDGKDNDGDGKIDEPDERVTNAKAGESAHNYYPSLAFDVAFKDASGRLDYTARLFDEFAAIVLKAPGMVWGGSFTTVKDRPHFELQNWKKMIQK